MCVCVYVCVCVRERETIKSTRLVHHRDDLPMGGAFLTPFMSCFPQEAQGCPLWCYFQALWSCQPRFWSVTKQREMFTTSRAISEHTSSLTFPITLSHLLPCPLYKPSSASLGGHSQGPLLPFAVFLGASCQACTVDCLPGASHAVGRAELWHLGLLSSLSGLSAPHEY